MTRCTSTVRPAPGTLSKVMWWSGLARLMKTAFAGARVRPQHQDWQSSDDGISVLLKSNGMGPVQQLQHTRQHSLAEQAAVTIGETWTQTIDEIGEDSSHSKTIVHAHTQTACATTEMNIECLSEVTDEAGNANEIEREESKSKAKLEIEIERRAFERQQQIERQRMEREWQDLDRERHNLRLEREIQRREAEREEELQVLLRKERELWEQRLVRERECWVEEQARQRERWGEEAKVAREVRRSEAAEEWREQEEAHAESKQLQNKRTMTPEGSDGNGGGGGEPTEWIMLGDTPTSLRSTLQDGEAGHATLASCTSSFGSDPVLFRLSIDASIGSDPVLFRLSIDASIGSDPVLFRLSIDASNTHHCLRTLGLSCHELGFVPRLLSRCSRTGPHVAKNQSADGSYAKRLVSHACRSLCGTPPAASTLPSCFAILLCHLALQSTFIPS